MDPENHWLVEENTRTQGAIVRAYVSFWECMFASPKRSKYRNSCSVRDPTQAPGCITGVSLFTKQVRSPRYDHCESQNRCFHPPSNPSGRLVPIQCHPVPSANGLLDSVLLQCLLLLLTSSLLFPAAQGRARGDDEASDEWIAMMRTQMSQVDVWR